MTSDATPLVGFEPLPALAHARFRESPDDFEVEEIPIYTPSGEGSHTLAWVEKRGLTSPAMVERVARAFGIAIRDVGWAGYKDRHAVTRQWISVPDIAPERLLELALPGIRVLEAGRHGNKIRTGHLRGNRFRLVIRGAAPGALAAVGERLELLGRRGLPNAFGAQRFGALGDNATLGGLLVRGDTDGILEHLCRADPARETPRIVAGREQLGAGRYDDALATLPREMGLERHVAHRLRAGEPLERALQSAPRRVVSLLLSAWQSACFNDVLARRGDTFDLLLDGEIAMKHENGATFLVPEAAAEAARAARLEISPTGPLPGRKMAHPAGAAGALEAEVLAARGALDPRPSALVPGKAFRGDRRPLRVPLADATVAATDAEDALILQFTLPRGSFATTLLDVLGVGADAPDAPATEEARG